MKQWMHLRRLQSIFLEQYVLETAPPELVADIAVSGIVLTGGGSLIYGMDRIIKERTGIEAYVSEKALEAVALGAGMSVNLSDKKED